VDTQEREFVLQELRANRERLLRVIDGLSREQQVFQPGEDRWSIADCLEHIPIVEGFIVGGIQRSLTGPAQPELRAEVDRKAEGLYPKIVERSQRVKGPDRAMPRRTWKDFAELIEAFESARLKTLDFAAQTEADLHNHFFPHPLFADLSCYHWLRFASLHSERHVLQMEEVKASPGYPG